MAAFFIDVSNKQAKSIERLSMTFTAYGKRQNWNFCRLSSAVCKVEWNYLYLQRIVGDFCILYLRIKWRGLKIRSCLCRLSSALNVMLNLSNIIVSHASKGSLLATYELKILLMMELIQSRCKIKILPTHKAFRVSHDSGVTFWQGIMSSLKCAWLEEHHNRKMWFTKKLNLPSSRLVSVSRLYLVDDAPPCKRDILQIVEKIN